MIPSQPAERPSDQDKTSKTTAAGTAHPRTVFPSVADALRVTPFFIDEEGVGPWLNTADTTLLNRGTVIMSARNAIHIPSLEQTGRKIRPEVIEEICRRAAAIGLTQIRRATGYWTLSGTGELQSEQVLIAFSHQNVTSGLLRQLASEIVKMANQDAVAIEVSGQVEQRRS